MPVMPKLGEPWVTMPSLDHSGKFCRPGTPCRVGSSLSITGVVQRSPNLLFSLVGYLGSRMELQGWTECSGFINSINSISNCFHVEPPWSLSPFQQQCQLWTYHLNQQGLWPCCWLSVAVPSWFFRRDSFIVGQSTQWGSCRSLSHHFLLRLPKNLKERQHLMLFSWDGSGTETTRYFRTSELAPSLGKKKKVSQFTLWFSLPSSPCSFNFHSRK